MRFREKVILRNTEFDNAVEVCVDNGGVWQIAELEDGTIRVSGPSGQAYCSKVTTQVERDGAVINYHPNPKS
ncbi:MAG: hypothetical protein NVSMB39_4250 [Candidatus Saccharimonadales bacterium]